MRGCSLEDIGCFCMTEIGHGSNVSGIETTATYDHETQEFVLDCPTESSVKAWADNLTEAGNK